MKIRIVKTGKDLYMVQRKYWVGWIVCGGYEWTAQCMTLKDAEEYVEELIETKRGERVIKEVTI